MNKRKHQSGPQIEQLVTDEALARISGEVTTFKLLLVAQARCEAFSRGDTTVTGGDVRAAVSRLRSGDRRQTTAGVAGGAFVTLIATLLAASAMPVFLVAALSFAAATALAVFLVRWHP